MGAFMMKKMWLENAKCQGKWSFMWIKSHFLSCIITVPMTTVDPSEAGFNDWDHCVFFHIKSFQLKAQRWMGALSGM